jgi:hypothetical protein
MSDKSGRKAHLGMGFDDRNDAFDFNATIQDFRRQRDTASEVIKPVVSVGPPPDLSLKEGQKISVQLKALKPPGNTIDSNPLSFLPPPPESKSRNIQTSVEQPTVQPSISAPMGSLLD